MQHNNKSEENVFIRDLRAIVSAARDTSYRMANMMQVLQNWLIGKRIVVEEQQGKARADYGKHVIGLASKSLTKEFGHGFSETQVRNYRKFYLAFSNLLIQQTAPAEFRARLDAIQQTMPAESVSDGIVLPVQLSWSHYERLIRIADPEARMWYMQEAAAQQWDYRTLKRNIDSQYYYLLKCFVLVDLKTTKVSYEDVGQMDMYLKLFDTYKRTEGDNPTIGIILCSETNADVARFSTLATNKQMYASKYLTYMPSKEVLAREIEQQKEIFRLRNISEKEV